MAWIGDESTSVTVYYLGRGLCHIVSVSAPANAHEGDLVTVRVDIQNTGDEVADLRVVLTDVWSGWSETATHTGVGAGQTRSVFHEFEMPKANAEVSIQGQHWE